MRALGSSSLFACALAALAMAWTVFGEHGVVFAQTESEQRAGEPDGEAPTTATEDGEELEWPEEPQPPFYATWWFWTAIGAVVLGVTLAIVVGLTTDDPVSGRRAGLIVRF